MVFLLGALCYTICTMKVPPQALEGPGDRGAFMAFIFSERYVLIKPNPQLAKMLGNSHATHGSGLVLINCIVADHSQL